MSGYALPGLRLVLAAVLIVTGVACLGLRFAPGGPMVTALSVAAPCFVALWCALVVWMLLRYDLARWVRGRR